LIKNDEVWKRHRAVASRAFSDANNRLVFAATLRCVGEMVAAWERQQEEQAADERGQAGAEVEVLEDVTQMALAVITAAAFGFPIHAAYGAERHRQQQQEEGQQHQGGQSPPLALALAAAAAADASSGSESVDKVGAATATRQQYQYRLSFTRCMEVVSQRTLTKVLLPAWALRLPVLGLSEVGLAFREFNQHLLDVVDRERALQRGERRRRRQLSSSASAVAAGAAGGGGGNGEEAAASGSGLQEKEKGQTLFRLLVQANEQGDEEEEEGEGGMAVRGRRLSLGELLGNAFIFLLAGR
jgi:hypothetical protein